MIQNKEGEPIANRGLLPAIGRMETVVFPEWEQLAIRATGKTHFK
jgi:hypothetical protein